MPRAYTHQWFKTPNHLQQFITSSFLCCNRLNYLQLIYPTNLVPFLCLKFSLTVFQEIAPAKRDPTDARGATGLRRCPRGSLCRSSSRSPDTAMSRTGANTQLNTQKWGFCPFPASLWVRALEARGLQTEGLNTAV